jgi:hypothetical protein
LSIYNQQLAIKISNWQSKSAIGNQNQQLAIKISNWQSKSAKKDSGF